MAAALSYPSASSATMSLQSIGEPSEWAHDGKVETVAYDSRMQRLAIYAMPSDVQKEGKLYLLPTPRPGAPVGDTVAVVDIPGFPNNVCDAMFTNENLIVLGLQMFYRKHGSELTWQIGRRFHLVDGKELVPEENTIPFDCVNVKWDIRLTMLEPADFFICCSGPLSPGQQYRHPQINIIGMNPEDLFMQEQGVPNAKESSGTRWLGFSRDAAGVYWVWFLEEPPADGAEAGVSVRKTAVPSVTPPPTEYAPLPSVTVVQKTILPTGRRYIQCGLGSALFASYPFSPEDAPPPGPIEVRFYHLSAQDGTFNEVAQWSLPAVGHVFALTWRDAGVMVVAWKSTATTPSNVQLTQVCVHPVPLAVAVTEKLVSTDTLGALRAVAWLRWMAGREESRGAGAPSPMAAAGAGLALSKVWTALPLEVFECVLMAICATHDWRETVLPRYML